MSPQTWPLGLALDRTRPVDVIGAVERAPSGNYAVRVGRTNEERPGDVRGWHQTAYVVLTPEEAAALAAALAPAETRITAADRKAAGWQTPKEQAAERRTIEQEYASAGLAQLLDILHGPETLGVARPRAEEELNRRGIETRQKHSGRLHGLDYLRRQLGLDDDPSES